MLTKDDLRAIGELLEPVNKKLDNMATKQDVKAIVAANNRVIGTTVRAEIAAVKETLEKKIEKRIARLEEDAGFPRSH